MSAIIGGAEQLAETILKRRMSAEQIQENQKVSEALEKDTERVVRLWMPGAEKPHGPMRWSDALPLLIGPDAPLQGCRVEDYKRPEERPAAPKPRKRRNHQLFEDACELKYSMYRVEDSRGHLKRYRRYARY